MDNPTTTLKSNIYTKTGDEGMTSLFNGTRHYKDILHFEALGSIDEVNSFIGMVDVLYDWNFLNTHPLDNPSVEDIKSALQYIQRRLLDIGSHVATPLTYSSSSKIARTEFKASEIENLEKIIDSMDSQLPKLTNFILPNGIFHVIRSSVRKAERNITSLVRAKDCSDTVLRYMNRLSDFFFVLARYTSENEIKYKKEK